jgi:hypothetical protein
MSDRPAFRDVTPDELKAWLVAYPRKLTYNVTTICDPPLANWNDFERAPYWPDSVVASASLPYHADDPPLSHCRVMVDPACPVPDDGKRDTAQPLFDSGGAQLREGDEVEAHWGWSPTGSRREKIIIRDKGTKYERWSFESCYNHARGFPMRKVRPDE